MLYEQQTQKQRLLIDSQTREQLLSLAADFPRVWNDPTVEPRERKRILRLLIEDVTLINGEMIQVHVRLRGGATRSLTVAKPLPIAQLRKTKPAVVAEIDALLDHLFFIHLESRRVSLAGITRRPDQAWMQQMARNATGEAWGFLDQRRYVLHDRDTKFCFAIPGDVSGWRYKTDSTSGAQPKFEFSCRALGAIRKE